MKRFWLCLSAFDAAFAISAFMQGHTSLGLYCSLLSIIALLLTTNYPEKIDDAR